MRYVCRICGYIYDEAKENTPFAALPDSWVCPLCGAAKVDFGPESGGKAASADGPAAESAAGSQAAMEDDPDLQKLSPGQLSALCSSLSRGCTKQYKPEEADLFRKLSSYFAAITPAVADANVESLARRLQSDVDYYSHVRAAADAAGDRGAARVCVWGEKVTRMLSSLVNRYLKEGEAMLADTNIWVCGVCGFVYIGHDAPELCPVCKVPSWNFEKIEGRAG